MLPLEASVGPTFGLRTGSRVFGPISNHRPEIFDRRAARAFPVGDFSRNGPYVVQNGPLGVSEQVRIHETWEKEPLGFPTGLARDRHAARDGCALVLGFLSPGPPSSQQPFLEFFSPLFTKNSLFFSFFSLLGPWPPPVTIPTPW
jgi:hypothetical protein